MSNGPSIEIKGCWDDVVGISCVVEIGSLGNRGGKEGRSEQTNGLSKENALFDCSSEGTQLFEWDEMDVISW